MTSAERRASLVRLLAEIDQRIAEAEELNASGLLESDERGFVSEQIALRRNAVLRIEGILIAMAAMDEPSE